MHYSTLDLGAYSWFSSLSQTTFLSLSIVIYLAVMHVQSPPITPPFFSPFFSFLF